MKINPQAQDRLQREMQVEIRLVAHALRYLLDFIMISFRKSQLDSLKISENTLSGIEVEGVALNPFAEILAHLPVVQISKNRWRFLCYSCRRLAQVIA